MPESQEARADSGFPSEQCDSECQSGFFSPVDVKPL